MKIKLRTIYASAEQNANPGDIISVGDKEGKALVDGGYAEKVSIFQPAVKSIKIDDVVKEEMEEAQQELLDQAEEVDEEMETTEDAVVLNQREVATKPKGKKNK